MHGAYTYLLHAVEEIRVYGRFVFRKRPERVKGYFSEYNQRHRRGAKLATAKDGNAT